VSSFNLASKMTSILEIKTDDGVMVPRSGPRGLRTRTGKKKKKGIEQSRLYNMAGDPPRFMKVRTNVPFHVVQTSSAGTIASSTTVPSLYAFYFALSGVDQYASWAAVFDQYRIRSLEVWTQPRQTITSGVSVNPGVLSTAVDYDDANSPATTGELYDYENALIGNGISVHYHRFHPHAAIATYAGAFTSYGNVESPWIDAASVTVQHYGIKAGWTVTDVIYTQDVMVKYHIEFRNVR